MKRIMIGVDGSPASLNACSWAGGLAAEHDADVLVVSVLPPVTAPLLLPPYAERRNRQHNLVNRWCAEHGLQGVRSAVVVLEGPPGPTLAEVVERRQPDLLIVGTDGAQGRFGPRPESVANQLGHRVPVPLLVVPAQRGWRGLANIVVGVDGSPASRAAVDLVDQVLSRDGALVTAVAVHRQVAEWVVHADPMSWYQDARRELECWTAPLRRAGHSVDHRVCTDAHPAPAILGVAADVDADLVVVGAHPFAPVIQLRFGGTAAQLLHHAVAPTMLVPTPPPGRRTVLREAEHLVAP